MRRVEVSGGELGLVEWSPVEAPAAPPIVCLHGFPDLPATFAPLAGRLVAAGRVVVAPWLRGYRPSTTSGPFTVDQLADDLLAIADALSPGAPIDVVGHDWGAVATYAACARAPERIRRAVTLAVPHPAAFFHNARRQPLQLARSWYMLFFQLPRIAEWTLVQSDAALVGWLWRDWSPGWSPPADHLAAVKAAIVDSMPAPIEYYRAAFRGLLAGAPPPAATIPTIDVPTLALHGARDGCIGATLGEGQERFFRQLRAEIVEDAGHFLHLERPEAVAERVLAWL